MIGGLSDGLGSLPYAGALAAALQAVGWGLTQAQLTSSYHGYGVSSLNQDADELLALSRCGGGAVRLAVGCM